MARRGPRVLLIFLQIAETHFADFSVALAIAVAMEFGHFRSLLPAGIGIRAPRKNNRGACHHHEDRCGCRSGSPCGSLHEGMVAAQAAYVIWRTGSGKTAL